MVLICLITFLTGVVFEAACVGWTHYAEKGRALPAALLAALIATTNIIGFGESIKDWRVAPFFILGYAIGTFSAIKLKNKYSKTQP